MTIHEEPITGETPATDVEFHTPLAKRMYDRGVFLRNHEQLRYRDRVSGDLLVEGAQALEQNEKLTSLLGLETTQDPGVLIKAEPVKEVNEEIQDYVSEQGEQIPSELLHLLSNLDWSLRNAGGSSSA